MMKILAPRQGTEIVVMDMNEKEIGRGVFRSMYAKPEGNYTVYECNDGAVMASGEHLVTLDGRSYKVSAPMGSSD